MDGFQAQDPSAYVYEGVWKNLDKTGPRSLTLTLAPSTAVILTNALALFVAMSGGQLWTIIRFAMHQVRATSRSESKSIIHNQQQIVLRNATTDIATARLMFYLGWISRVHSGRVLSACIVIGLLAIFNSAFFMVAGTFSNKFISAGLSVLSISPHCGPWNQTYYDIAGSGSPNADSDEDFALSVEFIAKREHDVQLSLQYAQSCYLSQSSWYWASTCGTYPTSRLNWTTNSNAPCPFESKVCAKDSATIVFDTGPIDSHKHLGINAAEVDRLTYRRVTQCTVLDNQNNYTTVEENENDTMVGLMTAYANYGVSLQKSDTNYTYSYSNFADFYTDFSGGTTLPYQLGNQVAYGLVSDPTLIAGSTFEPLPELMQSDADLMLLFLSFTGLYTHPVNDPWFAAHSVVHRDSPAALVRTNFARDMPISAIGCTEQHQFCSPNSGCTPLLGFLQVQQGLNSDLQLTAKQNVTMDRLLRAAITSSLQKIVDGLSITSTPLLAINSSATESSTLSLPLPDDQWQNELQYWHSIAMAQLQRTVLEYSTGQIAPRTEYLIKPQNAAQAWLCQNQTIQSSTYQSFSVLALALIFTFGTLIIMMSMTIEVITRHFQRRWGRGAYGRDMWKDHDMLGLQLWRMNFEVYSRWVTGSATHSPISQPMGGTNLAVRTPYSFGGHQWGFVGSSERASSQALSSGDEARFQSSLRAPSSYSPLRSAITADFVFDFGRASGPSPYVDQDSREVWDRKPLPEVPQDVTTFIDEKNFVIDRGFESETAAEPTVAPAREEEHHEVVHPPEPVATGSGPGRWAYYSAHKRRYGPRASAPAPQVTNPMLGGLRGDPGGGNRGNWI